MANNALSTDAGVDTRRTTRPSIYVASLSDYAAGRMYGAWIDAAQTPEKIRSDIADMLAASPHRSAEEWDIRECAGFWSYDVHEMATLAEVSAVAEGIVEHGELFAQWLEMEIAHPRHQPEGLLDKYGDSFMGRWDDAESFAAELLHERFEGADTLLVQYFDYAAYVRDMVLNSEISVLNSGGEVVVFRHPGPPPQHVVRSAEPLSL